MAHSQNQIFDDLFKALMRLSDTAIITFINALFGAAHPPGSVVTRENTEFPRQGEGKLFADMVITIGDPPGTPNGDPAVYHIETQIKDDPTMALRVFVYAFAIGKQRMRQDQDGIITIPFPQVRVIYLEPSPHTPDILTLRLELPEGNWDYQVKTFKVLDHSIRELGDQKLALLLPFYLLKIRRRLKKAKTAGERKLLAVELTAIAGEMADAFKRGEAEGSITDTDRDKLFDMTEQLYNQLYLGYTEFKEVRMRLDFTRLEKIDALYSERNALYSERDAYKLRAEAVEREKLEVLRRAEAEKLELTHRIRELEEQISRSN